jgi:hypothetical protein
MYLKDQPNLKLNRERSGGEQGNMWCAKRFVHWPSKFVFPWIQNIISIIRRNRTKCILLGLIILSFQLNSKHVMSLHVAYQRCQIPFLVGIN